MFEKYTKLLKWAIKTYFAFFRIWVHHSIVLNLELDNILILSCYLSQYRTDVLKEGMRAYLSSGFVFLLGQDELKFVETFEMSWNILYLYLKKQAHNILHYLNYKKYIKAPMFQFLPCIWMINISVFIYNIYDT